jgi:hypothetical protein
MDFEIVNSLRRPSGIEIDNAQRRRLRGVRGRGPWRKRSAVMKVRLRDGSLHRAVVHWYAAGSQRHEMKLKFPLLD